MTEQTRPTYLIGSSSVEHNGELVFINLGPGGLCLAFGPEHAALLGRELVRMSAFPQPIPERAA